MAMYELMAKYGLNIYLGGNTLLTPRLYEQEIAQFRAKTGHGGT